MMIEEFYDRIAGVRAVERVKERSGEILERVQNREVYLFGTGRGADIALAEMPKCGIEISGIISGYQRDIGKSCYGFLVQSASVLKPKKHFVIVVTMNYYPGNN